MWRCSRTVTVYAITDSIRKRVVEVSWALHVSQQSSAGMAARDPYNNLE